MSKCPALRIAVGKAGRRDGFPSILVILKSCLLPVMLGLRTLRNRLVNGFIRFLEIVMWRVVGARVE